MKLIRPCVYFASSIATQRKICKFFIILSTVPIRICIASAIKNSKNPAFHVSTPMHFPILIDALFRKNFQFSISHREKFHSTGRRAVVAVVEKG
jgi:hypothetical protein